MRSGCAARTKGALPPWHRVGAAASKLRGRQGRHNADNLDSGAGTLPHAITEAQFKNSVRGRPTNHSIAGGGDRTHAPPLLSQPHGRRRSAGAVRTGWLRSHSALNHRQSTRTAYVTGPHCPSAGVRQQGNPACLVISCTLPSSGWQSQYRTSHRPAYHSCWSLARN